MESKYNYQSLDTDSPKKKKKRKLDFVHYFANTVPGIFHGIQIVRLIHSEVEPLWKIERKEGAGIDRYSARPKLNIYKRSSRL